MVSFAASDLRNNFASALSQAAREPVMIEKRGKPEGVLISVDLFNSLIEDAEELADIASYDESMAEEGENIPWDELKEELGWQ